jgi:death-on-curing protein
MPRRWTGWAGDLPDGAQVAAHCRAGAWRALGSEPKVRDLGLLEAAAARPAASAFGQDAYPDLDVKAAALLHSLARNHVLVDGDKRLALAGVIAFYGVNGRRLRRTNDETYELIMAVAGGRPDEVAAIADQLRPATEARQ